MRAPPPLTSFASYPVTAGTIILAIIASIYVWTGSDVTLMTMDVRAWHGQPWRIITSIFPHQGFLHLAFNLYWLWVFGSALEHEYGTVRTLNIFVLFAIGSSLAEYAVLEGGVGLSGVGYGLFGLLWVLGKKDDRFRGVVDRTTAALFVGWFFLCIALTHLDILRIANIAHGSGAVLGLLLGGAITLRTVRKIACIGGLVVCVVATGLGASVARASVNQKGMVAKEYAYLAYDEQTAGNHDRAIEYYKKSLDQEPDDASLWFNLGISYQRLKQEERAAEAYGHAYQLKPKDSKYRSTYVRMSLWLAKDLARRKKSQKALQWFVQTVDVDPTNTEAWACFADLLEEMGKGPEAEKARTRWKELSRPLPTKP